MKTLPTLLSPPLSHSALDGNVAAVQQTQLPTRCMLLLVIAYIGSKCFG